MATILKDKKAVVLKLKEPTRVTTVIPTAKLITHKGATLVALPHRPDETRVLRQLGFKNIPDPLKTHYEFPKASGKFEPFDAQIETANFFSMNNRCFCTNSMGLGKTVSALYAFDYMKKIKLVNKVLVICPLSTMERTWADEIFKTFPHFDATVVYGSRERRHKLLKEDADIYIVNTDGLKVIETQLASRPDIDLVIVDEVAMFRTPNTQRWKTLNNVINKQTISRRVWALTGAPCPNEPTDAWAQIRVITPSNTDAPKYFTQFRDMTMRQITQFKWVPKTDAMDTVRKLMQPSIRFALDDCVDLPPQLLQTRDAEMTDEQKKAYRDMVSKLSTEYAGGQVLAVNEAVKANKLVQIACIAYNTDVLTDRGWVPIQNVRDDHMVWDGVEWVSQGGSVYKGAKLLVEVDGVRMTHDHKVWLGEWVTAKEIVDGNDGGRFDRTEVRLPEGFETSTYQPNKSEDCQMGLPVRLRDGSRKTEPIPSQQESNLPSQLRLPPRQRIPQNVRHSPTPNVGCYATSLCGPEQQRLQKLWRSWDLRVQPLGKFFRELLGGYAGWISQQAHTRPQGCKRTLLTGELQVGDAQTTIKQQTRERVSRNAEGSYDRSSSSEGVRNQTCDTVRTTKQIQVDASAGFDRTYDLLNCGPRNRFVVRGVEGQLLIVHNCGVAYGKDKAEVILPNKPRIDVLKEVIEESEGKVIVFIPLTAVLKYVAKELEPYWPIGIVHGETSKHERDQIFSGFQTADDPHVLVANPATMSHGLTLTRGTTIVWFAPIYSNDIYEQACARVRRPGQTKTTVIVHLAGSEIERRIYQRLSSKQKMQGILLDLMKEGIED